MTNGSNDSIDHLNTVVSKLTMLGWVLGLVWIGWRGTVPGLSILNWGLLAVVGTFGASVVIGGGLAMVLGMLTKVVTGTYEGSIVFFALGAIISPVVAFIGVGMIAPWLAFPEQTQSMLTFKCEQPLGPFTLGPDSNPSDAQIATLCSCIWDSLDPATRKLNEALNAGKQASEDEKKAYSEALGSAFQKCGALEL